MQCKIHEDTLKAKHATASSHAITLSNRQSTSESILTSEDRRSTILQKSKDAITPSTQVTRRREVINQSISTPVNARSPSEVRGLQLHKAFKLTTLQQYKPPRSYKGFLQEFCIAFICLMVISCSTVPFFIVHKESKFLNTTSRHGIILQGNVYDDNNNLVCTQ